MLKNMRERRAALKAQLDALLSGIESRDDKNFTEEEDKQFTSLASEIRSTDARISELEEMEASESRAAAARVASGETEQRAVGGAQVTDPPIYVPGNTNGNSFFRDIEIGRAHV